jgi:hypothetical protein
LLLTFPELRPEDFAPWVDPAEATRKGLTVPQLAEATAKTWREGLGKWGQDGERIARFRNSADVAIYTPGSSAGLPLAVLRSLAAPAAELRGNSEALLERTSAAVSGLLGLVGIDASPLQSREHILLSNCVAAAWNEGKSLSLEDLVRLIQQPPLERVGAVDLESFFPAKERFALAMQLNNLLASPGFAAWTQGEPLDVQRLLYTPEGKPRLSILSIAHLSDAERMFFVTLLLGEVVAWMRTQTGTSSLRAILYMDEIFGFFPPSANPPSKTPLLTLMKQARAFGLGVVLATQNPVDLDYKGLSNAGTWFLGRLQTERDKARVLEGLEGASAAAGAAFNRQEMEAILAGLGQRIFLMNNVHDDRPVVFQSRWALSYLRGPLSRPQIETLMAQRKRTAAPPVGSAEGPGRTGAAGGGARPVLPPGVEEVFVASRSSSPVYRPALLGQARVRFTKSTMGVDHWEEIELLALGEDFQAQGWGAGEVPAESIEIEAGPAAQAEFAALPSELAQAKAYAKFAADLKDHLYRTQTLTLWTSKQLKATSRPDESEADFRIRLSQTAREHRDEQKEKLRAKYAPKLATLKEQLRRSQQRVEKEKSQATQSTLQATITLATSVLSAFTGRKMISSANIGRAATSARAAGRVARERADIGQANETVEAVQQRQADLEAEFEAEVAELEAAFDPGALVLEPVEIKPKKSDISVERVVLAWVG